MNEETTKRKEFDVSYYSNKPGLSHQIHEVWEYEYLFCPKCGQKQVWRHDCCGGDYYAGEQYICTACSSYFYIPSGVQNITDEYDKQRLKALVNSIRNPNGM